jgi:hypothetical protein
VFEKPKIVHRTSWHPQFAFSDSTLYLREHLLYLADRRPLRAGSPELAFDLVPSTGATPARKDEALRLFGFLHEALPIAEPTPALRTEIEEHAAEALELTGAAQTASRELLDWLRIELGVDKPGQRLAEYQDLSADDFAAEVRKRRPKGAARLSPKTLAELAATHGQYADPERRRAARLRALEQRLAELVNQAYELSAEDIELLWRTAPPRMPGA